MKRKAVILVVAVLLLAGAVQVGFAASEDRGQGFKEACQELWANLSPEERDRVEEAREEFRDGMEALRAEFHSRRAALKEEYLDKLPAELREKVEEKMSAREMRRAGRMKGNGFGRSAGGYRSRYCWDRWVVTPPPWARSCFVV